MPPGVGQGCPALSLAPMASSAELVLTASPAPPGMSLLYLDPGEAGADLRDHSSSGKQRPVALCTLCAAARSAPCAARVALQGAQLCN